MKTKSQTTYILLDAGSEDVDLHNEVCQAINAICNYRGIMSEREFIKRFPMLNELRHALKCEIEKR